MSLASNPVETPGSARQSGQFSTGAPELLDLSIVTYNSARWLERFFSSLRAQRYPLDRIRILARDNGSTDATLITLKGLATALQGEFAAFELEAGDNVGFGRGHNANLARAQAAWMLVTNVDLEFEPDTLETLVASARSASERVASWECRQKPYEHPKHYHPATAETLWSSSACVLFRVSALREVGGYDPRLFLYGEDVELSYRLRDHGWKLHYVPRAAVWHYTYDEPEAFKPQQFLGSTLANVLIRCRYGSPRQVIEGFVLYASLFVQPARFPGQRRALAANLVKLLRHAGAFLRTRRRSRETFPFRLWDYEFVRHGAFHASLPSQASIQPSAQPSTQPSTQPSIQHPADHPADDPAHGDNPDAAAPAPRDTLPLVSVLVRTMAGRSGKLAEAVASVAAQTYPRIELVVVEDGSDTARGFIDSLAAQGRFEALRYQSLERQGRCGAGNAALALATGQWLGFLDDDDLLYADHVETLMQATRESPELSGVYGLAFEVRTEVVSEEPWDYRDLVHRLIYRQPFSRALLWHHNYLPIQTVLFRRELYDAMGGFDPELDNLEDWNLWVRYSLHHPFAMVDKVTSLYRVPANPQVAARRVQVLDDYYAKATAKHAQLAVTVSPTEVVQMADELARDLYLVRVPRQRLRDALLARPWVAAFYFPLRSLASRLRRRTSAGRPPN